MIGHLSRRAVLLLAAAGLAATSAAAAAFGGIGNPYPNPDPGNRRFRALAADPVFAALPPGAVRTSWQENPRRTGAAAGSGSRALRDGTGPPSP